MNNKFRFDQEKALEVLLYVAQRCPDMYHALKILYFADKNHISKYGRLICGDSYVAMKHGAVPSGTYDIIKAIREGWTFELPESAKDSFEVIGNRITPKREPHLDLLSESDIECLDEAIKQYGKMNFGQLKDISHKQPEYERADENDFISVETLVKSLPNGNALWDYLTDD